LAFFVDLTDTARQKDEPTNLEATRMGLLDKLLGRGKKAAGDVMGDSSLRREGAAQHEEMAQEQRNQAADAHAERENT